MGQRGCSLWTLKRGEDGHLENAQGKRTLYDAAVDSAESDRLAYKNETYIPNTYFPDLPCRSNKTCSILGAKFAALSLSRPS